MREEHLARLLFYSTKYLEALAENYATLSAKLDDLERRVDALETPPKVNKANGTR